MFSGLFPALVAIGGLSSSIPSITKEGKQKSRSIRSNIPETNPAFSTFPEKSQELFQKIYRQNHCFIPILRSVSSTTNSSIFTVPQNKQPTNTQLESKFPQGSNSCLSIQWKKKTGRRSKEWWGEWSLLWVVNNDNWTDIFFNRVYTEDKKLYSEGLAYKFEKDKGEWKGKERIQSGKREVTDDNINNLIIKPETQQLQYSNGEYGGFGNFDLKNICPKDKCSKLKNKEIGRRNWEFVSSSSDSKSYNLFNYSSWRDNKNGLFPFNLVSQEYYLKYYGKGRQTRSTESTIIPPTNSIDRYSKVNGFFELRDSQITYKSPSSQKEKAKLPKANKKQKKCSKKSQEET